MQTTIIGGNDMIIKDLSTLESDFCRQATVNTGSVRVRSMDIDMEYSLFVYYFKEYIHLSLSRYDDKDINEDVWEQLKNMGMIYPDVFLSDVEDMWINKEKQQLHAKLLYKGVETWKNED